MFVCFVIIVSESVSCPQCKKADLNIIKSLLDRGQIFQKPKTSAGPKGCFWTPVDVRIKIKLYSIMFYTEVYVNCRMHKHLWKLIAREKLTWAFSYLIFLSLFWHNTAHVKINSDSNYLFDGLQKLHFYLYF